MASIFTLQPLEEGGPIARGGFLYQDHVAAAFCLEILTNEGLRAIWCETQDDLVLDRLTDGNGIAELVQVKSDAFDQMWSTAKLYERKIRDKQKQAGTSIVERQLARDRGDEPVSFRLVTLRDVNDDLSCLKKAPGKRDNDDLAKQTILVEALAKELGNCVSPGGRDLNYWAAHMLCDVRESREALEGKNLLTLLNYLNSVLNQACLLSQAREVYADIIEMVRACAEARWAAGPELKRIRRNDFLAWFKERAARIPPSFRPDQAQELVHLERESLARCITRWRASGVSEELASSLAHDQTVGAPSPRLEALLSSPFVWLVGDFGSGKSLAVERIFQRQLLVFRNDAKGQIPVFLEAKKLIGRNLREEAEKRATKIGDLAAQGVLLVIDGIDEAGTEVALNLLSEAHSLSKTWVKSCVIVSSAHLPTDTFQDEKAVVGEVSDTKAVQLVQRIAGYSIPSVHWLPEAIRKDIRNPLIAVLLGTWLSKHKDVPTSKGELLAAVANRTLLPLMKSFKEARDLLQKLAALSTSAGGAPIPASELVASVHDLQPLIETRLIVEDNGLLSFSIATLAHWFAAEALAANIVTPEQLANDPVCRERWKYPLATFIGTRTFDEASRYLMPLVRNHPAFAAVVLKDGVRDWRIKLPDSSLLAKELGAQLRQCMLAWMAGLGPLASAVAPTDANGELRKLTVRSDKSGFACFWSDDPKLPHVQEWSAAPPKHFEIGESWSGNIGDQPAWVWKQTHWYIKQNLLRLVRNRQLFLPTSPLANESVWAEACDRTRRSALREVKIPLAELLNARPRGLFSRAANELLETEIQRLKDSAEEFLQAPYPQADSQTKSSWITSHFSAQRMMERTSAVYAAAVIAYREMVLKWFPHFAPRLRHFAILPAKITGVVVSEGENTARAHFTFYCIYEPLTAGEETKVELKLGSSGEGREMLMAVRDQTERLKQLRPDAFEWLYGVAFGGGLEDICQQDACSRIVYNWLEADLREVQWT